eukprot:gene15972-22103_t
MGNMQSGAHPFLHEDFVWEKFQSETEWRSARAKELDKLGGKLHLRFTVGIADPPSVELPNVVHQQGDRLQGILMVPAPASKQQESKTISKFVLHTDKRAAERRGEGIDNLPLGFHAAEKSPQGLQKCHSDPPPGDAVMDPSDFDRPSQAVSEAGTAAGQATNGEGANEGRVTHERGIVSDGGVIRSHDRPSPSTGSMKKFGSDGGGLGSQDRPSPGRGSTKKPGSNGSYDTSKRSAILPDDPAQAAAGARVPGRFASSRTRADDQLPPPNRRKGPPAEIEPPQLPPLQVAEWRLRVHRARRRVMITVLTMVRLKRGMKHPQRLPRLDDLSLFVPIVMGDDGMKKFVTEQRRYHNISDEGEDGMKKFVTEQRRYHNISDETDKLQAELEYTQRPPDQAALAADPTDPSTPTHGSRSPFPVQPPLKQTEKLRAELEDTQRPPDYAALAADLTDPSTPTAASRSPFPSQPTGEPPLPITMPGQHETTSFSVHPPLPDSPLPPRPHSPRHAPDRHASDRHASDRQASDRHSPDRHASDRHAHDMNAPGSPGGGSLLVGSPGRMGLGSPGVMRSPGSSVSSPGRMTRNSHQKNSDLPPIPWVPVSPSAASSSQINGSIVLKERTSPHTLLKPLEPLVKESMEKAAEKVRKSSLEDVLEGVPQKAASAPPARGSRMSNEKRWRVAGKASLSGGRFLTGPLPSLTRSATVPTRERHTIPSSVIPPGK